MNILDQISVLEAKKFNDLISVANALLLKYQGWVSLLMLETSVFKSIVKSWSRLVHKNNFCICTFLAYLLKSFCQSQNL